ncbi:MAG TPA: phosphoribosylaminoimidazolesuccinocarboxamide synthase, partial [Gemmatimonadaceae bacterium]|nr:phosphoribosylaminoimidazolesuccinocarboxamide synthase [Gemmatimonadaceae bacterium]
ASSLTTMAVSALPLPPFRRGKVRDVYVVDHERLLLVATDRVSAFDVVMSETIPHKGAVLTQITAWWLRQLEPRIEHHMISADASEIVREVPQLRGHESAIAGRAMLCRRTTVFPIECVVRGYLSGSAWKEYRERGTLAGESLHKGLRESERLDPPLFSPATKADEGHDENITVDRMRSAVGERWASKLESLSREIYQTARAIAAKRGIIIADTKFEFGRTEGGDGAEKVILVDEVLTPDSSRFWPADSYMPGKAQPSFDKQPLRDYLDAEKRAGRWDGNHPPPPLPKDVIDATRERYLDIYRRLTGTSLNLDGAH